MTYKGPKKLMQTRKGKRQNALMSEAEKRTKECLEAIDEGADASSI